VNFNLGEHRFILIVAGKLTFGFILALLLWETFILARF